MIQPPFLLVRSSSGRTLVFQSGNRGSTPLRATQCCRPRTWGVVVVTPPCQGGRAGSNPARCLYFRPQILVEATLPCGRPLFGFRRTMVRSPLCHSGDTGSIPVGSVGPADGTVRQLAERRSSNLRECGFNSHSCHSIYGDVAQSGRGNSLRSCSVRVRLPPSPRDCSLAMTRYANR